MQAIVNLNQCKKLAGGAVFKSGQTYLRSDLLKVAIDKVR